ncbi:MAG: basic amino acid ABC transporter substrate-binding protein [Clostridiales bacterium]|nr:basic amino acid ABC transporter substrate-binding protein [Clostridiales bacterium]
MEWNGIKLMKVLVFIMAIAMMMVLVGCGSNEGTDDSSDTDSYLAITEPTFAPFDTTDEDGNCIGFDMDLMDAIGEDQGFTVEYKALEFDALIPALETGQADMITAGMNAMDPARQAKVDFSQTYYDSGLVVLVNDDNETINGIEDLTADMKVASQIGTTGADEVLELYEEGSIEEAVILNGFNTAVLQLQNGDIDAIIIDLPVANDFIKKQPGKLKTVGEVLNAESYGFAVQKGDEELLDKINTGLNNVIDNGTYDELYTKWFEN